MGILNVILFSLAISSTTLIVIPFKTFLSAVLITPSLIIPTLNPGPSVTNPSTSTSTGVSNPVGVLRCD